MKSALSAKFDAMSEANTASFMHAPDTQPQLHVSPSGALKSSTSSPNKIDKRMQDLTASDDYVPFKQTTMIDTLILKVFCVLFCRGSHKEKALILFDAMIGPTGLKLEREQVSWKSSRMQKAFKYLIYFSEIFPKKYWSEMLEDDKCVLSPNKRLFGSFSDNGHPNSQFASYVSKEPVEDIKLKLDEKKDQKKEEKQEQKKATKKDDDDREFLWSEEYVNYIDSHFDEIFDDVYEDLFIDSIFSSNDSFVQRDDFIEAITTNSNDMPAAEWVFKTDALGKRFREQLPMDDIEKEIDSQAIEVKMSYQNINSTNLLI